MTPNDQATAHDMAARMFELQTRRGAVNGEIGAPDRERNEIDNEFTRLEQELCKRVGRNVPIQVWRLPDADVVAIFRPDLGSTVSITPVQR